MKKKLAPQQRTKIHPPRTKLVPSTFPTWSRNALEAVAKYKRRSLACRPPLAAFAKKSGVAPSTFRRILADHTRRKRLCSMKLRIQELYGHLRRASRVAKSLAMEFPSCVPSGRSIRRQTQRKHAVQRRVRKAKKTRNRVRPKDHWKYQFLRLGRLVSNSNVGLG